MINELIEDISVALNEAFGDGYEIYMEEIGQDLTEPCFFIQCLNPSNGLFRGRRYFGRYQFCIQYFPGDHSNRNRECYRMIDQLEGCLEYINTDDGLIRGTQMHGEVADGMLHYFVNYDCFTYKQEEDVPAMGELALEITVKEAGRIEEKGRREKGRREQGAESRTKV